MAIGALDPLAGLASERYSKRLVCLLLRSNPMKPHKRRQETEAVRGGTDLGKKNGPLVTPIYQTSTFEVTDSDEQVRATNTDRFYTRYGNPTHTVAESSVAELEGADG
ncbi:MAG: hypothetical protein DMG86_18965, partial [Acidobacteria bacterium]